MYACKSKLWSHFKRARVPARDARYLVVTGFLFSVLATRTLTVFSGRIVVNIERNVLSTHTELQN